MTDNRKVNRRLALVAVPLLALMIFGISCDQTNSSTTSTPATTEVPQSSTPSPTTTPVTEAEPEPTQMPDDDTMPAPPDNMDKQMPTDGGQPPMASDNAARPMSPPGGGMPFIPDMATLAATLGITQQEMEDAFAQAQEEIMADFQPPDENMTSPEEMSPDEMPEGTPPEMSSSESLYARVAEILGIDQDALETAIAEVMAALQESATQ